MKKMVAFFLVLGLASSVFAAGSSGFWSLLNIGSWLPQLTLFSTQAAVKQQVAAPAAPISEVKANLKNSEGYTSAFADFDKKSNELFSMLTKVLKTQQEASQRMGAAANKL